MSRRSTTPVLVLTFTLLVPAAGLTAQVELSGVWTGINTSFLEPIQGVKLKLGGEVMDGSNGIRSRCFSRDRRSFPTRCVQRFAAGVRGVGDDEQCQTKAIEAARRIATALADG